MQGEQVAANRSARPSERSLGRDRITRVVAAVKSSALAEALATLPIDELVEVDSVADAALHVDRNCALVVLDATIPDLKPSTLEELRAAAPAVPRVFVGGEDAPELFATLADPTLRFVRLGDSESLARELAHVLRPRRGHRLDVADAGLFVEAAVDGVDIRHRLADLSNRGLSFFVPFGDGSAAFLPGRTLPRLRIVSPAGTLVLEAADATIRSLRRERDVSEPTLRVGVSFEAPAPTRVPWIKTIDEPLVVAALLRKAARAGDAFVVELPDGDGASWSFRGGEVVSGGARAVLRLAGPPPAALAELDVVRLLFDHHGQSYSGLATVASTQDGLCLALGVPRSLRVHHRRASNRHRMDSERPLLVRLRAPLVGLDAEFYAHDLNAGGVSVAVSGDELLVCPGLVLESVELRSDDGAPPLKLKGVVRSRAKLPSDPSRSGERLSRCGIEFAALDGAARHAIGALLVRAGFPRVDVAAPDAGPSIWDFLGEAGFTFHHYNDGTDASRRIALGTLDKLLAPATGVAFNLVHREGDRLRGHIAGLRFYSRTWVGAHLAAVQGRSFDTDDRVTRSLSLALNDRMENEPTADFVKVYWKKEQRLIHRMHTFSGRAHRDGLSELREFSVFFRPNADGPLESDSAVQIHEADRADLVAVEAYYAATQTALRIQTDDLTADRLTLRDVDEAYARHGLLRRRRVRVAEFEGRRAGFALLEETSPAVHLAEATNGFDVVADPSLDAEAQRLVRQALIADAVREYTARGLRSSAVFTDGGHPDEYESVGFKLASVSRTWTWHRSLLRDWAGFWDQIFVRPQRRAGGRGEST